MRFSFTLLFLLQSSNAFLAPSGHASTRTVGLKMSSQQDEVAALRAAAAKAREDAERLAKVRHRVQFLGLFGFV